MMRDLNTAPASPANGGCHKPVDEGDEIQILLDGAVELVSEIQSSNGAGPAAEDFALFLKIIQSA
jgi:hypothetical protein